MDLYNDMDKQLLLCERSGAQLSINYLFLSNFARPDNLTVPVACAGLQVKLSKGN